METTSEFIQEHQDHCLVTRKKLKDAGIEGPWLEEPDRVEFTAYGFDCLLVRHADLFHWCGYVGITPKHPYMKKLKRDEYQIGKTVRKYWDADDGDLEVHGGITYREACNGYICHLSEKEDKLFWLGFECAHAYDLSPGMELHRKIVRELPGFPDEMKNMADQLKKLSEISPEYMAKYRDVHFVMEETKKLAQQLSVMET